VEWVRVFVLDTWYLARCGVDTLPWRICRDRVPARRTTIGGSDLEAVVEPGDGHLERPGVNGAGRGRADPCRVRTVVAIERRLQDRVGPAMPTSVVSGTYRAERS
jgi:hypothetical protein